MKLLLSLFVGILFVSCAHKKVEPVVEAVQPEVPSLIENACDSHFEFFAMGTPWIYQGDCLPFSEQEKLKKIIYQYDLTFSDWSEESELRTLEKIGMIGWQTASPLFLMGLEFSQKAFHLSKGFFDPTVGAVNWDSAEKVVGLEGLRFRKNPRGVDQFKFPVTPGRLTFGGLVKGMSLGAVVWKFKSIANFELHAGGGNLVQKSGNYVTFVSHSATHTPVVKDDTLTERQHLIDPKNPLRILPKNNVSYENAVYLDKKITEKNLLWQAAWTDAYTKYMLLR